MYSIVFVETSTSANAFSVKTNSLKDETMRDIFNINLEVYNLITIFATTSDIAGILKLINEQDETNFATSLRSIGANKVRYPFFIVGPVASGKTLILQHLRYFKTYEEWLDPVPPEMYVSHHNLSQEERSSIEDWVLDQLDKKNRIMRKTEPGFFFMDRAPLDALVFSESAEERRAKAINLSNCFQKDNQLVSAQLQFVSAEEKILEERNIRRGRLPEEGGDSLYLKQQTADLVKLYSINQIYDTSNKSAGEVAREIVISALLEEYKETDLRATLEEEASEN